MLLLFFIVWLILNGKVTVEICLFGLGISAVIFYFICKCMDYSWRKELFLYRLLPRIAGYFVVLVKEIAKANVAVMKLVLSPEVQPEPELVLFETDLRTSWGKAILADSITLTPGTITVYVEDQTLCVHCLDRELAEGIESSVFVQALKQMEEEEAKWK